MRWNTEIVGTAFLAALLVLSCKGTSAEDKVAEYKALDRLLVQVESGSRQEWQARIKQIKAQHFNDPEVKRIQYLCTEAYTQFGQAKFEMDAANSQLEKLVAQVESNKLQGASEKHTTILTTFESARQHLNQSEKLVKECNLARNQFNKQ